jgi:hypothetical protein
MDNLTLFQVETALCVWEELLAISNGGQEDPFSTRIHEMFDNYGTGCMRSCAIQAGVIVEETFTLLEQQGYDFNLPFDWEFVPFIVRQLDWDELMTDNQYGGAAYEPAIAELAGKALEAFKDDFIYCDRQQAWLDYAANVANRLYAYPGLITEDVDTAIAAYKSGESPKEYVERLGEKFNLTRR